ncbi:hypothetical protein ACFLU6_03115 [Acidobacteriota bacterium]
MSIKQFQHSFWILGICLIAILLFFALPSAAQMSPDSCKKCHKSGKVSSKKFEASAHGEFGCTDCHEVPEDHRKTHRAGDTISCADCHEDIPGEDLQGVHIEMDDGTPMTESCLMCHEDLHHAPRRVSCEGCHEDVPETLEGSEHWKAGPEGKAHRVSCIDCHSDVHHIRPSTERESLISPINVHKICGQCHNDPKKPAMNPITGDVFVPVQSYLESIHGNKLDKVPHVASCTDCHGHHGFRRILDPSSTLNRSHIIETCGRCHQGKLDKYERGVHGRMLSEEQATLAKLSPEEYEEYIKNTPLSQRPPICTSCHTSHSIRPAEHLGEFHEAQHLCSQCHEKEVKELGESIHLRIMDSETGQEREIRCQDCHVDYHENKDIRAKDSVFNKRNLADICARCHELYVRASNTGHTFHPIESYKESVHGRGVYKSGLYFSAGCVDCHGSHYIFKLDDHRSLLHHEHLADTCGNENCHVGIHDRFLEGTHGKIFSGERAAFIALSPEEQSEFEFKGPVCIDCHVSHEIKRTNEPAFYDNIIRQCGHCHPLAMATYKKSYHGKAALLGATDVAKCHDCHGSHVNPRVKGGSSPVSSDRVLETCRGCHKKATQEMVSYINHLELKKQLTSEELASADEIERQKYFGIKVLRNVRFFMELLLVSVFIFFGIHTILWFIRGMVDRVSKRHEIPLEKKTEYYVRIDRYNRILHVFVIVSFMGLALTGLPIKYPEHEWSRALFDFLDAIFQGNGGQVARLLHRIFAIITFGYLFFHLINVFHRFLLKVHGETMNLLKACPVDKSLPPEARGSDWYLKWLRWWIPLAVKYVPVNLYLQIGSCLRQPLECRFKVLRAILTSPNTMVPRWKDAKDMWANFKWFFWLGPKPKWDRWTYYEKFDYWAVFWGVAIIGSTGLCMWFKEFFTATLGLPGWIINVAMEVHSHEALLAVGFIFSIHFFNGHLRPGKFPLDRVIFLGVINRHELEEERPEEFKRLLEEGKLEEGRGESPPMWLRIAGTLFGVTALILGIIIVVWIFKLELAHVFAPT